MIVSQGTWSNIVFGLVILVLFGVVGFGMASLLLFAPEFSRTTEQEAKFAQYQASAEQFKGRMYDYKGACSELALPEGVICADEEAAYRILERIPEGGYYCADHTGFAGPIASPPASALACNL